MVLQTVLFIFLVLSKLQLLVLLGGPVKRLSVLYLSRLEHCEEDRGDEGDKHDVVKRPHINWLGPTIIVPLL